MASTTLTRFSTVDDIVAVINENADYDSGAGSVSKAQLYVKGIRLWMLNHPERATHGGRGGEELVMPFKAMEAELERAIDWLQAAYAEGSTKYLDFSEYRS